MAENPLVTLTRLLGGVVLMQGNLGHQVLGQLLVANTNEVALAGAFVVIAGTTGQKNAVGQIALRTVAPALAVRALLNKQEQRLERLSDRISDREDALERRRRAHRLENLALRTQNEELKALLERLRSTQGSPVAVVVSPPDAPLTSPLDLSIPVTSPASPLSLPLVSPPPAPPSAIARRRPGLPRPTPPGPSGVKKTRPKGGSKKR